jgi:4-hydroxybenzoyl-CoA reductase subunit beta
MPHVEPFTLETPRTVAEAAFLLGERPGALPIAGGTDLLPNLRRGLRADAAEARRLVDLSGIPELRALTMNGAGTTIGAGVTLARLASDPLLRATLPIVSEAAMTIAAPGHRSVATLGGNLCLDTRCVFYNQSAWWRGANDFCLKEGGDTCHVAPQGRRCHAAFSGDLAPAFLVLDASVDIVGPRGARRMPLANLYQEDGAAHLALKPGELVAAVHVPPQPPGARSAYRKARARGATDFPLAGVAARVEASASRIVGLRVALTGTNSRPFVLEDTASLVGKPLDDALLAELAKRVRKQASPMRTTVTQSNYRRQVAAVLAQRLLCELVGATRGART